MEERDISQAVIGRLPRYFRYLGELKDQGVERISSQDLSEMMKAAGISFPEVLDRILEDL